MKIAYVISTILSTNKYNGIRMQAETWANELIKQGHELIRINPWQQIEWNYFDVVHVIGADRASDTLLNRLSKCCKKIIFSPIIDTIEPIWKYKIATYTGCRKLRLYSVNYALRQSKPFIKRWVVRSMYEAKYVNKAYDVPTENISIIPLSFRTPIYTKYPVKEPFCLHVSMLTDSRKNVKRLVEAAAKYKFRLILAGSIRTEQDFKPIHSIIERCENITYLGRVSDEELIQLYKKAKVFALPSINEGVGLVAVEAASYGCDIVITKIGGPKEYYADMAYLVDPYNVDEIGQAIMNAMTETRFQPKLQLHIQEKYNLTYCVNKLIEEYNK